MVKCILFIVGQSINVRAQNALAGDQFCECAWPIQMVEQSKQQQMNKKYISHMFARKGAHKHQSNNIK